MTLLTIVQNALGEVGDFDIPDSIAGSSNPTAGQALKIVNKVGKKLARLNWTALQKEHSFTTVSGQAEYDLPADFREFINGTWWDVVNHWPLEGPASPAKWQDLQSGLVTAGLRRWFRVRGDKFMIYPTPTTTGDAIKFEYRSNAWAKAADDTALVEMTADNDVSLVDEYLLELGLIYRFLKENEMDYAAEEAEYSREVGKLQGSDGGAPVLNMGDTPVNSGMANIPETGVGL